jgi:hypothetical protein
MITLSSGLSYFDLNFMDLPRIIAAGVIHGAGGVAIIDPGPASTLPRLRSALATAGLSLNDVTTILLTHIHLDHGGATGTLLREQPRIRVYVHEKGAPHMANPEKLLASATRLYGDAMGRLWGEVVPVPPRPRVTSRQLFRSGVRRRVCRRHRRRSADGWRFRDAADPAARRRPRCLAAQPRTDRTVAARNTVPDALRTLVARRDSPEHDARPHRAHGQPGKALARTRGR